MTRRQRPINLPAPYLKRVWLDKSRVTEVLSHSHGEGFLRFFEERCGRQGIFLFDEPESALSPSRQLLFLRLLQRMERSGRSEVIMATHAPLLMAYPGATLLLLIKYGLDPVRLDETEHFKLMRDFCADPGAFVHSALEGNSAVP
jgi:predicted ATPase